MNLPEHLVKAIIAEEEKKAIPDSLHYPPSDDMYIKGVQEENTEDEKINNTGLDVPGSELDDADEDIGSEDEENNYYSIGGDNHNDLEEDKGE